ncbi:MAG TPA: hypothetical protein VGK59_06300 [Ohtaekwangia sp.]
MNAFGKTAWLIGTLEDSDVMESLVEKGYALKKFRADESPAISFSDDQPDMIIFSEDCLHKDSLFFTITKFFPNTLAVSIGSTQPQPTDDTALEASMDRLIESLRSITKA